MSDHLPECSYPPDVQADVDGRFCVYCVPLRACEQRVEEAMDRAWTNTLRLKQSEAFANGVQAAREAVDVALLGTLQSTRDRVLDALDALRGSGNPDTPPSAEKGEQA